MNVRCVIMPHALEPMNHSPLSYLLHLFEHPNQKSHVCVLTEFSQFPEVSPTITSLLQGTDQQDLRSARHARHHPVEMCALPA